MASSTFAAKDGGSTSRNFGAEVVGSTYYPHKVLVDVNGAPLFSQKTKTLSIPVVPASDWALLGSGIVSVSDTFQRPASTPSYAGGKLVANHATAASVIPLVFASAARFAQGAGKIWRCRLSKTSVTLTNAQFRLHVYSAAPANITNGDGGDWLTDLAGYIGALDVTMNRAFNDGACGEGIPSNGDAILFKLASGSSLRGLIAANASYTGVSSESFTATLEIEQT